MAMLLQFINSYSTERERERERSAYMHVGPNVRIIASSFTKDAWPFIPSDSF